MAASKANRDDPNDNDHDQNEKKGDEDQENVLINEGLIGA